MRRGHICVVAGAGAGKTRWLVEHYLELLRQGLRPTQLVAITFTDKAAAEMRERITTRLLGQGGAEELLASLELAPISTIHSFCVTLLREFAPRVGLEPGFDVLDEPRFLQLVDEALEEVIAQALARAEPAIELLLEHYSLATHELPRLVRGAYLGLLSVGVSPAHAQQVSAKASKEILREFISQAEAAAQELRRAVEEARLSPKAKFTAKVQRLVELWPWEEGLEGLERVRIEELRGVVGGRGNWAEAFRPLRAAIKQALGALLAASTGDEVREGLLGVAHELWERVERRMREVGGISFAHQLQLALRLLENHEDVLRELRGRYKVILVDEFQDTDPIQARIVGLLTGLEGPPGPGPSLVIVGDPAQSIYSFRGAQARIFGEVAREITSRGGQLVQLTSNYRSCKELVELFNSLFSTLELARAAGVEGLGVEYCQVPRAEETALGGRAVEVVDLGVGGGGGPKLSTRQRREAEAEAVARYVLKLRQEGVRAGDIVILMRQRTGVEIYEQALSRAGIEFYTVGGRGFFVAPEVRAMVAGLRAVVEPADELALVGWLRSIFVGLDEDVVVALGVEGGSVRRGLMDEGLWPGWASATQRQRLGRARDILLRLEPLAHRLGPAELLERLMEEVDAEAVSLGGPRGEQAAANLRKLIEIVRAAIPRVEGGTRAVVHWLLGEVERALEFPGEEAQAPLAGEQAEVVRIMTVHGAKGLEFPVVLLVDLGSGGGGGGNSRVWVGPQGEVALKKVRDPLSGQELRPPIAMYLKKLHEAQQAAESLRLFYVASTRATRRLVFFLSDTQASGSRAPKTPTWAHWVRDHVLTHPQAHIITPEQLPTLPAPAPAPAAAWEEFLPPSPGPQQPKAAALIARCTPSWPRPRLIRTTVSAMEEWFACPRRWWLSERVGLDLATVGSGPGVGQPRARVVGSAVHALLELADLRKGPQALEEVAARAARASGAGDQEMARALELARLWFSSPLRELVGQAVRVNRELELVLSVQGEVALELMGVADLVVWGKTQAVVVDYKVGSVEPGKYEFQMRCYGLALERATGMRAKALLGFFGNEGVELVEVECGPEAMGELDQCLRAAAKAMAGISPWATVEDVPGIEECPPHCPARGICGRDEE